MGVKWGSLDFTTLLDDHADDWADTCHKLEKPDEKRNQLRLRCL